MKFIDQCCSAVRNISRNDIKINYLNLTSLYYIIFFVLLILYVLLIYGIYTQQYRLDFSSFYSSSYALAHGDNPYQILVSHYLKHNNTLSVNLNPPFVVFLLMPLSKIPYNYALISWIAINILAGFYTIRLILKLLFHKNTDKIKQFRWLIYSSYFAFYPVLINTIIAQLGAVLFFLIINGYYLLLQKKYKLSGFFWGIAFSLKLFPGLLLIFAYAFKKYTTAFIMLCVFIFCAFVPYYLYGVEIYQQYFSMFSSVLWYADSWNASIFGFLYRLNVNSHYELSHAFGVKTIWLTLFLLALVMFWYKSLQSQKNGISTELANLEKYFSITLILMLLLSPMGWMYYFSLLFFPLAVTARNELYLSNKIIWIGLWFLCLILINFPTGYVRTCYMLHMSDKLGVYSIHFYGLILLLFISCKMRYNQSICLDLVPAIISVMAFGLVVVLINAIISVLVIGEKNLVFT